MKHVAFSFALLALLSTSGCGDKTDKTDDSGGGGSGLSKKIIGKWEMDVDAIVAEMKAQVGELFTPEMEKGIRDAQPYMEFKADGTAAMVGPEGEQTGKWKATGESGSTLNIEMTEEGGKTDKMMATFSGDDEITLSSEGDATKLTLKRAK